MADVVNSTMEQNITDAVANATQKIPATPEGMALAYTSLFTMAIVSIWIGSFKSVRFHKEQKVKFCFQSLN